MSRIVFIILLLCVFASSGCMVVDELDKANKQMDAFSGTRPKPEADDSESIAGKALKTKNELLEQSKQWWDEATTLSPAAVDTDIVTCRVAGETQFMSKDDCILRGGVAKGVSG